MGSFPLIYTMANLAVSFQTISDGYNVQLSQFSDKWKCFEQMERLLQDSGNQYKCLIKTQD